MPNVDTNAEMVTCCDLTPAVIYEDLIDPDFYRSFQVQQSERRRADARGTLERTDYLMTLRGDKRQ